MANKISRRDFLRKGGIGLAAATVVPNVVLGKSHGHTAPSDKLNIAGVGVGGRGASVLKGCESQNIVALCDTDWNYAKKTFDRYPNARRFWDYRTMLDQVGNTRLSWAPPTIPTASWHRMRSRWANTSIAKNR